jgi:cytochrome c553
MSLKFRMRLRFIASAVFAAVLAPAVLAHTALAQEADEAKIKAGLLVWKQSACADCHGNFANGDKARDEMPTGANLRTTRLNATDLAQTIACGRPGTGMPYFDEHAYTEHACYGQALGPVPDGSDPGASQLSAAEIGDVIAYLQARIIGRGEITRAECDYYYGALASSRCADFK